MPRAHVLPPGDGARGSRADDIGHRRGVFERQHLELVGRESGRSGADRVARADALYGPSETLAERVCDDGALGVAELMDVRVGIAPHVRQPRAALGKWLDEDDAVEGRVVGHVLEDEEVAVGSVALDASELLAEHRVADCAPGAGLQRNGPLVIDDVHRIFVDVVELSPAVARAEQAAAVVFHLRKDVCPPVVGGHAGAVLSHIASVTDADLLEVVGTRRRSGRLPRGLHRRQPESRHGRDDRDDDQQLDERKGGAERSVSWHVVLPVAEASLCGYQVPPGTVWASHQARPGPSRAAMSLRAMPASRRRSSRSSGCSSTS